MGEKKIFKGIDLAEKIMEFVAMTPDSNQWNTKALYDNPPRQIRLYQIQSLMMAFIGMERKSSDNQDKRWLESGELKPSLRYFLSGDFIRSRTETDYVQCIEFIKAYMQDDSFHDRLSKPVSLMELSFIFPKIFSYKTQLRNLMTFNSGWMEAGSMTAQFSISLTNSISRNLVSKFDILDRTLEWFINPLELSFTLDELVAGYQYPKENLSDIDIEYY